MRKRISRRLPWCVYTVPSDCIALTFDDGPSRYTAAVLDILARRGHRATFFIVPEWGKDHASLLPEIVAAGHEIGNHTYSHPRLSSCNYARIESEFERADRYIREQTGITTPIRLRPPFGDSFSPQLIMYVLKRRERFVNWTVQSPGLETDCTAQMMIDSFRNANIRGGDILLLHDDSPHIAAVLDGVLDLVEAAGFKCKSFSECVAGRAATSMDASVAN